MNNSYLISFWVRGYLREILNVYLRKVNIITGVELNIWIYDSNGCMFSPDADAGIGDDVFKLQRFKAKPLEFPFQHRLLKVHLV